MSLFDKLKNETLKGAKQIGNKASVGAGETIRNAMQKTGNQSFSLTLQDIPKNLDELAAIPEANLREPHYAAALLIPALCIWSIDENTGMEMFNFLKGPKPLTNYEVQFIRERLRGKEYLPFSYFRGTTPENGYEPTIPYTIEVMKLPGSNIEEGYIQLYLKSSGADSPRPVRLREKPSTKEWFLWDQMLLADIRIPVSQDPWA